MGSGSGGHSHADTLSLVVYYGSEEILVDAGTYTYVGDEHLRNEFRGTAAHNTVRIDGLDQADPVDPFRWANPPDVRLLGSNFSQEEDIVRGECRYREFVHTRHVHFLKAGVLLVADLVEGPKGEHTAEQFWHAGSDRAAGCFVLDGAAERRQGWRSRCFGQREPAPVYCVTKRGPLPLVLGAAFVLNGGGAVTIGYPGPLAVAFDVAIGSETRQIVVEFPSVLR
jgi:hypothetical protein